MSCLLLVPALLLSAAAPVHGVCGQYVEARTCDVYTGACFANADTGLTGKNAVLAWKVSSGTVGGTRLDGLGVVAVVAAHETLGLKQATPGKAILIVDEKATPAQRAALIALVKAEAGDLVAEVVDVRRAPIDLTISHCDDNGCSTLRAGAVCVTTRCLDAVHDRACGNESAYYPPLAKGVSAKAAMATENRFAGHGLNGTWNESDRRGAYVGSFVVR